MGKLLYIQASPRGERSYSTHVADAFVSVYGETHPDDTVHTLNIFEVNLPSFDGLAVQAKYSILHGMDHTEKERQAWKTVEAVIQEFLSADRYVISVPMWNFGIPYRLKQYVDLLVQPGYTFSFDPMKGYEGLVKNKRVLLACARGNTYLPGSEMALFDHQVPYLKTVLSFIGLSDISLVVVEPTLAGGPDGAAVALNEAIEKAKGLAADF